MSSAKKSEMNMKKGKMKVPSNLIQCQATSLRITHVLAKAVINARTVQDKARIHIEHDCRELCLGSDSLVKIEDRGYEEFQPNVHTALQRVLMYSPVGIESRRGLQEK